MRKLLEIIKETEGESDVVFAQAKKLSDFIGMFMRLAFVYLMVLFCIQVANVATSPLAFYAFYAAVTFFSAIGLHLYVLIGRIITVFVSDVFMQESSEETRKAFKIIFFASAIALAFVAGAVGQAAITSIGAFSKLQFSKMDLSSKSSELSMPPPPKF